MILYSFSSKKFICGNIMIPIKKVSTFPYIDVHKTILPRALSTASENDLLFTSMLFPTAKSTFSTLLQKQDETIHWLSCRRIQRSFHCKRIRPQVSLNVASGLLRRFIAILYFTIV